MYKRQPPAPAGLPPPPAEAVGPLTLAAQPAAQGERVVMLPFAAGTGAAAFRRGDQAVVVFDERRPLDLAPLRAVPAFADAAVQLLPRGTVLRLKLAPAEQLVLTRAEPGWKLAIADPPAAPAILPEVKEGRLLLPAPTPGQVMSVPDPMTGGTVLVGTVAPAKGAGPGVAVGRATPEFTLLPSWLGVALTPMSDALVLRPVTAGFLLAVEGGALAVSAPDATLRASEGAQALSRRFDLPDMKLPSLMLRLQAAVAAAAAAPPQARAGKRLEVAQAMLSLGMDVEAQAVLTLAATEDGRAANLPDLIGLSAMAAMLAGRMDDATPIDDPRLSGTDEVALWRAVRQALADEGSPQAAPVFAATMNLLRAYPAPLRARLLPLAVETMALGGEAATAKRVADTLPDDHALDLARALLAEKEGATDDALARYGRLAAGPDRLIRLRAARRAAELRLASGAADAARTADALDKLIYAWRGDGRELALRLRVAELRGQSGAWRPALAMLRETEGLYPDQREEVRSRLAATFSAALENDAKSPLPPLELLAMAEDNADLLPKGEAGTGLAARLADRLIALDLPQRAAPALQKLADAAPPGPVRAELGGKLAAMRLQLGDARGALAALEASLAIGPLPPEVLERRTLTFARAAAMAGDRDRAIATLATIDSAGADDLRAGLLEAARDYPGAVAALRRLADRTIPPEGKLNEDQARLLLRLASAAAQAGDAAMLARLRESDAPRLPEGRIADMFRLITAPPVQAATDLPRAAQEARAARTLPENLRSLSKPTLR